MKIEELEHIVRMTRGGAKVLVLNTGAIISPEAEAMLQALHSRSTDGVEEHLKILAEKGSEKFMETFYVGYGHKSIGDCGTGTIFIEGVSMLVAKAIQDWQLYSGQEASTRYIDFVNQPFVDPVGSSKSREVLKSWRSFYLKGVSDLPAFLKEKYPQKEGEKDAPYEKAINARAFDIMRGFLPASATTNLAWHTNLRQATDKLMLLRHHPLPEVRDVAEAMEDALKEAFPSSFGHKRYNETEAYNAMWMEEEMYFEENWWRDKEFEVNDNGIDYMGLSLFKELLNTRPPKTDLPKHIGECGTLQFRFLLDFGSFRDIQRHRAIIQRMPLVTMNFNFEPWYIKELPNSLAREAVELITAQEQRIIDLDLSPEIRQYYIAMGFNLPNRITGTIPALVYLVELRATRFVHPTLRKRAIQMADELKRRYGYHGLVLHLDDEPDRFDIRRGEHDIVQVG